MEDREVTMCISPLRENKTRGISNNDYDERMQADSVQDCDFEKSLNYHYIIHYLLTLQCGQHDFIIFLVLLYFCDLYSCLHFLV